jgi:atypical dual specificity phosphatase
MSTPRNVDDIDTLEKMGFTDVLNLNKEGPLPRDWFRLRNIRYHELPIENYNHPTLQEMDWVWDNVNAGGVWLIHCGGGVGRAGTVLACLIVMMGNGNEKEENTKIEDTNNREIRRPVTDAGRACKLIRWARPRSIERDVQVQFVNVWASHRWKLLSAPKPIQEPSHLLIKDDIEGGTFKPGAMEDACLFLIGRPGSGKTWFAESIIKRRNMHPTIHINQDEYGTRERCEKEIQREYPPGTLIIFDRCNPTSEDRAKWIQMIPPHRKIYAIYFDYHKDLCRQRMDRRINHPTIRAGKGRKALNDMDQEMEVPTTNEGFDLVIRINSFSAAIDLVTKYLVPSGIPPKFPRTPHILDLGATTSDDIVCDIFPRNGILDGPLTIEEKIDGANVGISLDAHGRLLAQNRSHLIHSNSSPQFKGLDTWLQTHREGLYKLLSKDPAFLERYILYGEWCQAKHSINYTRLDDRFLAFDLYDRVKDVFCSRRVMERLLKGTGIKQVPLIKDCEAISKKEVLELLDRRSVYVDKLPTEVSRSDEEEVKDILKEQDGNKDTTSEEVGGKEKPIESDTSKNKTKVPDNDSKAARKEGRIEGLYIRIEDATRTYTEARGKIVRGDFIGVDDKHWTRSREGIVWNKTKMEIGEEVDDRDRDAALGVSPSALEIGGRKPKGGRGGKEGDWEGSARRDELDSGSRVGWSPTIIKPEEKEEKTAVWVERDVPIAEAPDEDDTSAWVDAEGPLDRGTAPYPSWEKEIKARLKGVARAKAAVEIRYGPMGARISLESLLDDDESRIRESMQEEGSFPPKSVPEPKEDESPVPEGGNTSECKVQEPKDEAKKEAAKEDEGKKGKGKEAEGKDEKAKGKGWKRPAGAGEIHPSPGHTGPWASRLGWGSMDSGDNPPPPPTPDPLLVSLDETRTGNTEKIRNLNIENPSSASTSGSGSGSSWAKRTSEEPYPPEEQVKIPNRKDTKLKITVIHSNNNPNAPSNIIGGRPKLDTPYPSRLDLAMADAKQWGPPAAVAGLYHPANRMVSNASTSIDMSTSTSPGAGKGSDSMGTTIESNTSTSVGTGTSTSSGAESGSKPKVTNITSDSKAKDDVENRRARTRPSTSAGANANSKAPTRVRPSTGTSAKKVISITGMKGTETWSEWDKRRYGAQFTTQESSPPRLTESIKNEELAVVENEGRESDKATTSTMFGFKLNGEELDVDRAVLEGEAAEKRYNAQRKGKESKKKKKRREDAEAAAAAKAAGVASQAESEGGAIISPADPPVDLSSADDERPTDHPTSNTATIKKKKKKSKSRSRTKSTESTSTDGSGSSGRRSVMIALSDAAWVSDEARRLFKEEGERINARRASETSVRSARRGSGWSGEGL